MSLLPVSVIIPTYNRAHLLPRAVKSAVNQILNRFLKKDIEIGVGMLNFNNSDDTINCHKSIINSVNIPNAVVILDNASGPAEKIKLMKYINQAGSLLSAHHLKHNHLFDTLFLYEIKELKHFLILVQLKKNIGFCSGNNLIVKILNLLGIKYVLILNNDTEVFPKSIEQLLDTIKETGATAVSPLIYDKDNKIWYAGGDYSWYGYRYIKRSKSYKNFYSTNVYSGCCVIFLTSEYLARGGMEDSLFISLDEPEFSGRIRKEGGKILVEPRAKISHKVGRSIGRAGSAYHDYFWVRNRFLYSLLCNNPLKHSLFLILYCGLRAIKWVFYFFKKQNHRIRIEILAMKDYFSRNFGPGSLWKELNALKFDFIKSKKNL